MGSIALFQRGCGKSVDACSLIVVVDGAGQTRNGARCCHAALEDAWRDGVMHAAQVTELKRGIATFYDKSSGLWENMWGDHMHHGYYPKGGAPKSNR